MITTNDNKASVIDGFPELISQIKKLALELHIPIVTTTRIYCYTNNRVLSSSINYFPCHDIIQNNADVILLLDRERNIAAKSKYNFASLDVFNKNNDTPEEIALQYSVTSYSYGFECLSPYVKELYQCK